MNLVFLLEERSMKELLNGILPKILPEAISFQVIPHNGKSDLQRSISKKMRRIVEQTGKEAVIRIVCRELESWYFGDLRAVSLACNENLEPLAKRKKYRIPDEIGNPKEELKKIIPVHQQTSGARRIGPLMNIDANTSESFRQFVQGGTASDEKEPYINERKVLPLIFNMRKSKFGNLNLEKFPKNLLTN